VTVYDDVTDVAASNTAELSVEVTVPAAGALGLLLLAAAQFAATLVALRRRASSE